MGITRKQIEDKINEYIDDISSGIDELIDENMEKQPYEVTCSECGEKIEYDKSMDADQDMILAITPCECTNKGD